VNSFGKQTAAVLPALLALVPAGCAHFENKPLSPAQSADILEELSLDDPQLRAFISTNLHRGFAEWPTKEWDFEELTLVAVYFRPELDVVRTQWAVAKAGIITAGGQPNPTVAITPEYAVNPGGGVSPWIATLGIDWPIETAGKRGRRIARAKEISEAM